MLPLTRRGFNEAVAGKQATAFAPTAVAGLVSFGIRGEL
jgi:hypothetical protein